MPNTRRRFWTVASADPLAMPEPDTLLGESSLQPKVDGSMHSIDPNSASPWLLFGGVFMVASLGGLAALLRSGQNITPRQLFSALLNSGLVGLIIALLLWSRYGGKDPYLLFGVSALAGFGGATTIDLIQQYVRKKLGLNESATLRKNENRDDK